MAGLLNKITKSISGDHSQATLNTGAPTTENVQHGSTATHGGEPAFRENVFDDKMTTGRNTHGTHGLGQEGGLHGSGHHTTGTTGGLRENIPGQGAHGSSAMGMGHDGMSRHDASLEGRHTGHTGGMHHENMPGSTSLGTSTMGRENMSRHDAALEGRHAGTTGHGMRENMPGSTTHGSTMGMGHNSGLEGRHNMGTTGTMGHGENLSRHDAGLEGRSMGAAGGMHENIPGNTATHGGMGTGMGREGGMGRHDAALQGGNIASQDHHAANPRNDLHTANLGRHDVPGESLSHGNSHGTSGVTGSSTTTATGPVHNSKLLNKLDPRVKEHKEGHMGHHEGGLSSTTGHGHHNTTGAGAATNLHGRDPLDATQVPPSVMQQHRGPPIVEHEFPHDSKHKRHSVSHQEDHVLR